MASSEKRVLKPGADNVFVNSGSLHRHVSWRLDVRESSRGHCESCAERSRRRGSGLVRSRLFHYIAAGGLRQLRRTSADDDREVRHRSFLVFLGLLFVLWLVFYFVPLP